MVGWILYQANNIIRYSLRIHQYLDGFPSFFASPSFRPETGDPMVLNDPQLYLPT